MGALLEMNIFQELPSMVLNQLFPVTPTNAQAAACASQPNISMSVAAIQLPATRTVNCCQPGV
jgi:hypothetical protein